MFEDLPQNWKPHWTRRSFHELAHLRSHSLLDSSEIQGHGVYLFVRRFLPHGARFDHIRTIESWIEKQLSICVGELSASVARHFGSAALEVRLGDTTLKPMPRDILMRAADDPSFRQFFHATVNLLPPQVLYCGETHSYAARIRQHLDGSEVWNRLARAGFVPQELDFWSLPFPDVEDPKAPDIVKLRRSVELLFSQLTLAPFTCRPG